MDFSTFKPGFKGKVMKIVTLAVFVVISVSCMAQSEPPCPLASAVTIDGNADEWPMTWIDDGEKNFSYNVCADDQNLYVRVKTSEFFTKRKMVFFGFTMWFDPAGKKKKKYGLKFPCGGAEAEDRMKQIQAKGEPGNSSGERADFQKLTDRMMIESLEVMELIGLADDAVTATRSGITNGIKVAIGQDESGAYVYEALIPFKSYRLSKSSMESLSVGFETGKLVMKKQKPTTKNAALAGGDLTTSQLSRMQGYQNAGNPKLTFSTNAWTKLEFKK